MTALNPIDPKTCIVRSTRPARGRHLSVTPQSTAARHLHYGRITGEEDVKFSTGNRETALVCLGDGAQVNGEELERYDAIYLPRDTNVTVKHKFGHGDLDLAEVSAPVEKRYPVQLVYFREVQDDPSLHFRTGGPGTSRTINILIGKNVEAGRIMAGVTFSEPGNWTSWPPHEHAQMLEEAYLYIHMNRGWGVQMVYNQLHAPELVTVVQEDDVVLMPQGYHPNVAAPGGSINFLWMMAAIREGDDRQFGVVNVQPKYAAGGSGLEASRE